MSFISVLRAGTGEGAASLSIYLIKSKSFCLSLVRMRQCVSLFRPYQSDVMRGVRYTGEYCVGAYALRWVL